MTAGHHAAATATTAARDAAGVQAEVAEVPDHVAHGIADEALHPDAVLALLGSARAMRHLRDDPVDTAVVDRLLWAATRASSPNNTQHWHFVVVTEPQRRQAVAEALRPFLRWIDRLPPPVDPSEARTRAGARQLLESIAAVPVLVVVCCEAAYPPGAPDDRYLWATVGTATQNLLVAARAHGLGATVTMFHVADEQAVANVLGVPSGVRIGCIVPIGHPARPFGPVRRRPLAEVVHRERW